MDLLLSQVPKGYRHDARDPREPRRRSDRFFVLVLVYKSSYRTVSTISYVSNKL